MAVRCTCLDMFLFLIIQLYSGSIFAHDCQTVRNTTLMCHNYIPKDLPELIENVDIIDMIPKTKHDVSNACFEGSGWSHVRRLQLATVEKTGSYTPKLIFNNNTFSNLCSLEYLRLFVPALIEIKPGAFKGLDKITEFDLSFCKRTSVFYLSLVLGDAESMPNLKTLRIDWMNSYHYPPLILTSFDENVFDGFLLRNVTSFSVKNTFISTFDVKAALKLCDTVQAVDLSFSTISKLITTATPCKSLKSVILTNLQRPSTITHLHYENINVRMGIFKRLYFFRNIEELNMDNWLTEKSTFINTKFSIDSQMFQLVNVSIQNNYLQYLDLVIKTDAVMNVKKLELQGNIMQYFNGESWQSTPSLNMLNMSNNQLSVMQKFNTSDFEKMFDHLKKLQILDLSDNGLTSIPNQIFNRNRELRELYIRNNYIEQLALNSSFSLSVVDLRNNRISELNKVSRDWFNENFEFHANRSNFYVNISGNPFQCNCKDQEFLRWFVQTPLIKTSSQQINCFDHGKDQITPQLIMELKETCERPIRLRNIAITSTIGTVIFIAATVSAVVAFLRRRKRLERKKTEEEIIAQIQDGTYQFHFPVFLSYSNEDADYVMANIYPPLTDHLRQKFGTPRDLVCIGDRHFTLGRGIYDEILRCLENSAVVLNVVSNNFCESAYCRNELEQAYTLEKPILLLFIEEVNEENMSPLMKELFRKYARIKTRLIDDEIQVVPDWAKICRSILELLPR